MKEFNSSATKDALDKNINDRPMRSVESKAVEKYKVIKFIKPIN